MVIAPTRPLVLCMGMNADTLQPMEAWSRRRLKVVVAQGMMLFVSALRVLKITASGVA